MKVFVKICGMTQPENLAAVCALKPDAVGFVFWPHSRRYVDPSHAKTLVDLVPADILRVGVFVDRDPAEIKDIAAHLQLDVVQLHDAKLRTDQMPCRLWRVVHLDRPPHDISGVDALLIDKYTAASPGGTGEVCNWTAAADFVRETDQPVVLAGGLTPDNVADGIRRVQPWGVDVSSGVESDPGMKDTEKVRKFIETCRNL